MKKLLRLSKMLLVAVGLLAGVNEAWAATVTVNSWNFAAVQQVVDNKTPVSCLPTTVKNGGTALNLGSSEAEGLAFQGADLWFYYTSGGLYNGNSGGRQVGVLNLKAGDVVTFTADATLTVAANAASTSTANEFTVSADGNAFFSLARSKTLKLITVTREVSDDVCETPSYKITTADGTKRKFTLECLTPNSTIYYSETEKTASDAGWTEYTGEVTTSAANIWAYAKTDKATSDVITFATGAGKAITLNTPVITKTAYADGNYTISIGSDQSTLSPLPTSVSYSYTIDGGDAVVYTAPFSLAGGSTVTVHAEAEGYTNSLDATATVAVRPLLTESWSIDFASQATADKGTVTISEKAFEANGTSFGTITADGLTSNDNFGVKTETSWLLRHNNRGLYSSNGSATPVGIANLTKGQYVVITVSGMTSCSVTGAASLVDEMSAATELVIKANEDGNANINFNRYVYIKSIAVYDEVETVSATIKSECGYATFCSDKALDFSAVEGLTAYIVTSTKAVAQLKKVTKVPAGTGLVLKGDEEATYPKTYEIPVIATADAIEGNLLKAAITETTAVEGDYVLANKSNVRAFFPAEDDLKIPAGKAYLHIDSGAPAFLPFDAETTGISATLKNSEKANKEIFNLAGQRVSQPTKGLYIVGGRKVVVK